jgi:hypothetical protein
MRQQARDWLRADLALGTERLKRGKPAMTRMSPRACFLVRSMRGSGRSAN